MASTHLQKQSLKVGKVTHLKLLRKACVFISHPVLLLVLWMGRVVWTLLPQTHQTYWPAQDTGSKEEWCCFIFLFATHPLQWAIHTAVGHTHPPLVHVSCFTLKAKLGPCETSCLWKGLWLLLGLQSGFTMSSKCLSKLPVLKSFTSENSQLTDVFVFTVFYKRTLILTLVAFISGEIKWSSTLQHGVDNWGQQIKYHKHTWENHFLLPQYLGKPNNTIDCKLKMKKKKGRIKWFFFSSIQDN